MSTSLDQIEQTVQRHGLAVVGVSAAVPCEDCGRIHDETDTDAFAYTVGRSDRGEPEFLTVLIEADDLPGLRSLFNFLDQRSREGHAVTDGQRVQARGADGSPVYWLTSLLRVADDPETALALNDTYTTIARQHAGAPVDLLMIEREDRLAVANDVPVH